MTDALLKPEEVRDIARVGSVRTVHLWANTGQLPSVRIGRLLRFRRSDIEKHLGITIPDRTADCGAPHSPPTGPQSGDPSVGEAGPEARSQPKARPADNPEEAES